MERLPTASGATTPPICRRVAISINPQLLSFGMTQNNNIHFVFSDSPIGQPIGSFSVYTSRTINVSYNCESYKVLKNGDGLSDTILVDTIGNVNVSSVPNSTYYFTQDENQCGDNTRCSIVTAFESSNTAPWYYTCNITLGETQHDPLNISWISDDMALIATSAIAQIGYTDNLGVSSQIYPWTPPGESRRMAPESKWARR